MPKELMSGQVDFEFTAAFWKTYKPASVDGKELDKALKAYEKSHKEAMKVEALDDVNGTNLVAINAKKNAWGVVVSALAPGGIKHAMKNAIALLTKEKDSHKFLKMSIERAHVQLERGSHILWLEAVNKKDKYQTMLNAVDTPKENTEEDRLLREWMDSLDMTGERNWSLAGLEFQKIVKLHNISIQNQSKLKINAVFLLVSRWKRSGVFTEISNSKSIHSDMKRQIENLTAASKQAVPAVSELLPYCKDNKALGDFLADFMKDITDEKLWWQTKKKECPVKETSK